MKENAAKNLVVLGILLQGLHVLFGFTAILGMFLNHMLIDRATNSVYYSQIKWQLITFWVCTLLYAMAFWLWLEQGHIWPLVSVLLFATYRVATSVLYCYLDRPLNRIL